MAIYKRLLRRFAPRNDGEVWCHCERSVAIYKRLLRHVVPRNDGVWRLLRHVVPRNDVSPRCHTRPDRVSRKQEVFMCGHCPLDPRVKPEDDRRKKCPRNDGEVSI